eukprot:3587118-Prymnesium_polylepis.1
MRSHRPTGVHRNPREARRSGGAVSQDSHGSGNAGKQLFFRLAWKTRSFEGIDLVRGDRPQNRRTHILTCAVSGGAP